MNVLSDGNLNSIGHLKIWFVCFLILTSIIGCNKKELVSSNSENEFADWIKLEIPNGREAFAVVGDINKRLLVTTWTKGYYSDDKGLTWNESHDFQGHILELHERNDTVFALISTEYLDKAGYRSVGICNDYTTNFGLTWESKNSRFYSQLTSRIGTALSDGGMMYQVKENLTPVSPGSMSYCYNPSSVQKFEAFSWQDLDFPMKLRINNIHIDKNNFFYMATSMGEFGITNNFLGAKVGSPAIIYVSKKVLP